MYQEVLTSANYAATHIPWDLIAASGIISPLLVAIKKWRITKDVESWFTKDWFVFLNLMFITGATASINYLLSTPSASPKIILLQTALLTFTTQPIYFFVVKPIMAAWRKAVDNAVKLNTDIKSAAAPLTVSPVADAVKVPTPPNVTTVQSGVAPISNAVFSKSIDVQNFDA